MEYLNNYVLSVCFVMIFCIVIEALTPSERYKKIIKIVSGIFVLYTLLTPLHSLLEPDNYNFDISHFSLGNIENYKVYEEKTKKVFENMQKITE